MVPLPTLLLALSPPSARAAAVPAATAWTAVEPVGARTIELKGGGELEGVEVEVNGAARSFTVSAGEGRVLLDLDGPLEAGSLQVRTADGVFSRVLAATSARVASTSDHAISPWIYGQAFTPSDQVRAQGVSVVRWGGNAVSLYNPALPATNLANDWYFENIASSSAEDWIDQVHGAGALAFLTVPVLDHVAGDTSSCSFPVSVYGAQRSTDPWRPDCGDGVRPDGSFVTGNDPDRVGAPWDAGALYDWLSGMSDPPTIVAVGNELDIASSTHRDVHPDPVDYDELFNRWYAGAQAVRRALPGAVITGPSSCCWWFYWNDAAGTKADHGGQDLLPWWLARVAAADAAAGERRLDVLDIHYYPAQAGVFSEAVDPDTRALRLRSTRALWDPSYTDESWIGTDIWATALQPDPNQIQLIPRFQRLIDELYPGTALGIGEWNLGAEADLSGGLAVADALGIFGWQGLDLATYWTTPAAGSPAAAAFALYRQEDLPFGARSLHVDFDQPDLRGVYAALDEDGRTTVVIVNKDPSQDLLVDLGLAGRAQTRRFGGAWGGALVDGPAREVDGVLVVPAYAAALFVVDPVGGGDTGGAGDGGAADGGAGDGGVADGGAADGGAGGAGPTDPAGCGCGAGPGGARWGWVLALGGLALLRGRAARRAGR